MCKSKIHRATVTQANLYYSGSITMDAKLMREADILPYERLQIANVNSGARFETYAIEGGEGTGEICLNGAAARKVELGDIVLIISYATYTDEEARRVAPKVIHVDSKNRITKVELGPAHQAPADIHEG